MSWAPDRVAADRVALVVGEMLAPPVVAARAGRRRRLRRARRFAGVTDAWKISVHVAGLAGALAVVTVLNGPWGLGGIPVLALLGWAGVRLGAHSLAQVLAGAVVGAAVVGATLARLR